MKRETKMVTIRQYSPRKRTLTATARVVFDGKSITITWDGLVDGFDYEFAEEIIRSKYL